MTRHACRDSLTRCTRFFPSLHALQYIDTTSTYSTTEYTKHPPTSAPHAPLTGHDSPNTPPARTCGSERSQWIEINRRLAMTTPMTSSMTMASSMSTTKCASFVRCASNARCVVSRARTRAMHEFLNVDRVPRDSFIVRSYATMDERTDERTRRYRSNRGDGDARAGGRSVERARDACIDRSFARAASSLAEFDRL